VIGGPATRTIAPALVAVLLAAGCVPNGSGQAEPVDVPLSVTTTLAKPPTADCRSDKATCMIHLRAVIRNNGQEDVWAMFCEVVGKDADGDIVLRGHLNTAPAGIAVDAGRSTTDFATIGPIRERRAAALRSLAGKCDAYVWHGQVPI
jgi:hypothetical protein